MIKAILFDFNGILIDDEPLQMKAYQEVLKDEDIELTEKDYYDSLGTDDVAFVREAYKRANTELKEEILQRVLERKMKLHRQMLAGDLPLFDGAVNFVKQAQHHFTLGIVSMARNEDIIDVLSRAGILDAFSVIVSAEEVSHHKPDPECYNLGFREIDELHRVSGAFPLVREEVLVIEDAPPGVVAAKAAGMWVLGVTNTVTSDELRQAGADSVTKTLADWAPETVELVFR
ncbi:MAG: HAD family phosphatase [Pyrinomonadaceae bacterium]